MKCPRGVQVKLPPQFGRHRHVKFRIIRLHILCPVLLPELLDHRLHTFRARGWHGPNFRRGASRINPNRPVPEHVPVPLSVRALNREEVELFAFQNEPDWNRDGASRPPSDHADLDLAVAGEAVSEGLLRAWHVLPLTDYGHLVSCRGAANRGQRDAKTLSRADTHRLEIRAAKTCHPSLTPGRSLPASRKRVEGTRLQIAVYKEKAVIAVFG